MRTRAKKSDKDMIPLIKSSFYDERLTKKKLADFILNVNWLSMGRQCARFEKSFAKKQGRKYAVFVSSGSMANLILIQALLNRGILEKGDRIGVSALTWPTNIMPLIQLGLEPVFIDCDLETLNVTSKQLLPVIKKIDALFLTNVLGFGGDLGNIQKLCRKEKVVLLEDNCESLGSKVDKKLLGNFGLASTFSFFVGHHLSTIEGGMICTDDEELHSALVLSRAHGWDRNLSRGKQKELRLKNKVDDFYAKYTFYDLAFNARPTEISGFLGNIQIKFWDKIVAKRHRNFLRFYKIMKTNDDFRSMEVDHVDVISNFAMPVVCRDILTCDKYKARFNAHSIEIRPIIAGNMNKQPFLKKYSDSFQSCSNADFVHENGFYFPNNPELTDGEMLLITTLLKK